MLVFLGAGGALLGAAAPAVADPRGEVSQSGRTVGVRLQDSSVVLSGSGLGAKNDGYRIKRPCWYEPGKSAEEMLKIQKENVSWWVRTHPGETEGQYQEHIKQFEDKIGKPGRWWSPAYNAADPNGLSCWAGLEGALWVPQGETPPAGITAQELTQIARAALTVPEPKIKLSPEARSYVNLPTWVWLGKTGPTTRSVTATLPGVMSVTVTARLDSIKIRSGTTGDRAEVRDRCGATGRPYAKDGTFTCGVRYLRASIDQPNRAYTLSVTAVWPVTGAAKDAGGGPVAPSVYDPAYTPVEVTVTRDVPVGEVQSVVRR
jgi:enoyl reductase